MLREFLIFLFFSIQLAFCAEIAYVDLYAGFLFHPSMKGFHFPNFRFLRMPAPEQGQSLEEFEEIRKKTMRDLSRKIARRMEEYELSLREMNRHLMGIKARGGPGYRQLMEEERNRWNRQERQKEIEIEKEADRFYLSQEESRSKFAEVWREIRAALKALQEEFSILAFLPVSESSHYILPEVVPHRLDQQRVDKFRSPWAPFLDKAGQVSAVELRLRMEAYLSKGSEIERLFAPFTPSWVVPVGGVERTEDLLIHLHRSYKIPQTKIEQILEVYWFWKRGFVGDELAIFREKGFEIDDSQMPEPPPEF